MKNLVKTIILTLLSILLGASCSNNIYQKKTEELLINNLKAPSSYKRISFELESQETLREQIQDRLSYFNSHLQYYYDAVERAKEYLEECKKDKWMREYIPEYEKRYESAKKDLGRELKIIDFLNKQLDREDNELDATVARNYKLTYEAQNPMGVMLRSTFYSRFNQNDELVAIKQDDEDWTRLGDFFSIPGYHKLLEEEY